MNNPPRIAAIAVALLVTIAVILTLMLSSLHYSSVEQSRREWPPVDSSELIFADEFVAAGAVESTTDGEPSQVAQSAPEADGNAINDLGPQAKETQKPVTTERPQAMTSSKAKDNEGTRRKAEEAEKQAAKARKESAEAISKRVNFGGKSAGGNGTSAPKASGDGGGNSASASASVGGRSMEHWVKPSARATGSITVRVSVDRRGRVVRADYQSGTGAVASSAEARQSCERAAMKSQFSVALDGPASQIGTITYRFR